MNERWFQIALGGTIGMLTALEAPAFDPVSETRSTPQDKIQNVSGVKKLMGSRFGSLYRVHLRTPFLVISQRFQWGRSLRKRNPDQVRP